MRLLTVVGTRPEAVKMAPVLRALGSAPHVRSLLCVTGQHREMLDSALGHFGLAADIDLDLMRPGQALNTLLARAVERLDAVMAETKPDRVLVQGDTTTALAAAQAAHHRRIPVGHVEAGLRTYAPHPWPEEMNRRVIALIADLHFAPTEGAAAHLSAERVPGGIFVTGNTGIDALRLVRPATPPEVAGKLVLITGHRRESFGAPFEAICAALLEIARRRDVTILYPVHPNPAVSGPVRALLGDRPDIRLVAPLDLPDFAAAMRRADLILTDSGGVQEEAAALGKPALVLRDVTERPESVAAGYARLVGTNAARIVAEAARLLDDPPALAPSTVYGDGKAAGRIVDILLNGAGSASAAA